jgi:TetR/AcrR family transcriptional regulator, transcriptional repressor for nem operon
MFTHGVAGTSLEDVQIAAAVSSSQIYHYFRDKREQVRAVIAAQTEAVLATQQPLLRELDVENLRRWRDLMVGSLRERNCIGCPLGWLAGELAEADLQARAALAEGFDKW